MPSRASENMLVAVSAGGRLLPRAVRRPGRWRRRVVVGVADEGVVACAHGDASPREVGALRGAEQQVQGLRLHGGRGQGAPAHLVEGAAKAFPLLRETEVSLTVTVAVPVVVSVNVPGLPVVARARGRGHEHVRHRRAAAAAARGRVPPRRRCPPRRRARVPVVPAPPVVPAAPVVPALPAACRAGRARDAGAAAAPVCRRAGARRAGRARVAGRARRAGRARVPACRSCPRCRCRAAPAGPPLPGGAGVAACLRSLPPAPGEEYAAKDQVAKTDVWPTSVLVISQRGS